MAFDLFQEVYKRLQDRGTDQSAYEPDIPQEVRSFLGHLGLLKGVPMHYIVPSELYLPKKDVLSQLSEPIEQGALKLFWLDTEWLECLMDGALSISPDDYQDLSGSKRNYRALLLEKAMAGNYVAEVFYQDTKDKIKKQLVGTYTPDDFNQALKDRLDRKGIILNDGQPLPTPAQSNWCYTGFFMRSVLIAAWVGVEVVAKGRDSNESTENRALQVVRLERIAEDTLFCICEGIITEIDIVQPFEGIHFEAKAQPKRNFPGVLDIKSIQDRTDSATLAKNLIAKPVTVHLSVTWEPKNASS